MLLVDFIDHTTGLLGATRGGRDWRPIWWQQARHCTQSDNHLRFPLNYIVKGGIPIAWCVKRLYIKPFYSSIFFSVKAESDDKDISEKSTSDCGSSNKFNKSIGKKAHRTCLKSGGVCSMVDQSGFPVQFGPAGSSSRLNSRIKRKYLFSPERLSVAFYYVCSNSKILFNQLLL